jgi:hypothetical protein
MAMRHFPSIWQGSTLGHQIDRTLSVHRDSFDATQDRGGIRLRGRLQAHCRRGGSGWRLPGVAQGSTNRGMGGVGRMPHCAELIDKSVHHLSARCGKGSGKARLRAGPARDRQCGCTRMQIGRIRPGAERPVVTRRQKISWASSLLSRVIRSRALDAGRVTVEDAIRHDASAGGLPENACLCAHFVALPPSARPDHASRPAAYLSR